jgi:biotin carboxyl carrier protein
MAEDVMTMVPGNVWKVLVEQGDKVDFGDVLFILEVMKTEVPHTASEGGPSQQSTSTKAKREAMPVSLPW